MLTAQSVPPHSDEIEGCALGAMFDPDACSIAVDELKDSDFYVPRHKLLFAYLKNFSRANPNFDEISLVDFLTLKNALEKVGGRDYIGALVYRSSPASIEGYCKILKDRAAERTALDISNRLLRELELSPGVDIHDTLREMVAYADYANPATVQRATLPTELLAYDTENDQNCVLGKRWLCRGGSLLLVGQSGLGKSSFQMQAAVTWAMGEPLFGITPIRPLKSLLIQAENDIGDLAEEMKGVLNGLNLAGRAAELDQKIVVVSESIRTSEEFTKYLRALVLLHKPDICWIDPYLAYLGGDINSQEDNSKFLRNGLNPVAQSTGCIMALVHHTPKPSRDPGKRNGFVGGDFAYLGAGSAEVTNWARAVLILQETTEGVFELRGAKRGKRAGLVDSTGGETISVYLKHSASGICWVRSDSDPNAEKTEAMTLQAQAVVDVMDGKSMFAKDLVKIIKRIYGCKDSTAYSRLGSLKKTVLDYNPGVKMYTPRNSR